MSASGRTSKSHRIANAIVCLWHDLAVQTGANKRQVSTHCSPEGRRIERPLWRSSAVRLSGSSGRSIAGQLLTGSGRKRPGCFGVSNGAKQTFVLGNRQRQVATHSTNRFSTAVDPKQTPSGEKFETCAVLAYLRTTQSENSLRYSNGKTRRQSFFISTTVHPFARASSSALSRRPKGVLRS